MLPVVDVLPANATLTRKSNASMTRSNPLSGYTALQRNNRPGQDAGRALVDIAA